MKVKINSGFQHAEVAAILDTVPELTESWLSEPCVLKATMVIVPDELADVFAQAIEDRWALNRSTGYQTNAICSVRRSFQNAVSA